MEFFTERHVTARKTHRCEACGGEIRPGETYCRQTGKWEGDFFSRAWCAHCEAVMNYYFDFLATEQEFTYDGVRDDVSDRFCYECEHGPRQEDDCSESVWSCPNILRLIQEVRSNARFLRTGSTYCGNEPPSRDCQNQGARISGI